MVDDVRQGGWNWDVIERVRAAQQQEQENWRPLTRAFTSDSTPPPLHVPSLLPPRYQDGSGELDMNEFRTGLKKRESEINFGSNMLEWLTLFFLRQLPNSYLEAAYDGLLEFECEPWSEKDDQILLDWVAAKNYRMNNQGRTLPFFDDP